MTSLFLQVFLLLTTAFVIGAALACGLRRLLAPAESHARAPVQAAAPRRVEPLPGLAAAAARAPAPDNVARYEAALRQEPPRPAPAQTPPAATMPVAVPAPPKAAVAPPPPAAAKPVAPMPSAATPVAAPPAVASVVEILVPPPPRLMAAPTAVVAPAVVAAVVAAQTISAAPISVPTSAAAPTPAPAAARDNLQRIRGIDPAIESRLNALGVSRYSQIARWMRPEVERVNQALGFKGRVERENWIEQAQILASGSETAYARRATSSTTAPTVTPAAVPTPPPTVAVVPASVPTASLPSAGAAGIAAAAAAAAAAALSVRPSTPVAMAPAPTTPRVADRAAFAHQTPNTEAAPVVMAAMTLAPEPILSVAATVPAPGLADGSPVQGLPGGIAVRAETIAVPTIQAQPIRPSMAPMRDGLQRISGINVEIERLLNVQGITRYGQIAGWGASDVERFDRLLGSPGRVRRENWIEQSQILARGGETSASKAYDASPAGANSRPARAAEASRSEPAVTAPQAAAAVLTAAAAAVDRSDTPTSRTDISSFRSVRSDAFQSRPGEARAARAGGPDDLKRVRGVGVLIEKRLNAMGVATYEQIANWTADDIARFSQMLDFKGRIERENWVEQARILAAGGFTEFSRRVDKGEVETSRPRS